MDVILEFFVDRFRNIIARAGGPLNFRLVVMPTVVTILAIKGYLTDVREGHPLFLGAFLTSPTERRRLLRSGLKHFGRIFIVACILDTIYQVMVLKAFHPGEMVFVAVMCAVVPYFLVRGPITRLVHLLLHRRNGSPGSPAAAARPNSDGREGQE
jgi:hypothetical protein